MKDSTSAWKVIYWDGTGWVDEQAIDIVWDGLSTGPTHDCVENAAVIVYASGGAVYEGMFTQIGDSSGCGTGLNDSGGPDGAIVYLRHVN